MSDPRTTQVAEQGSNGWSERIPGIDYTALIVELDDDGSDMAPSPAPDAGTQAPADGAG